MKTSVAAIASLCIFVLLNSCDDCISGSGHVVRDERDVSEFDAIYLNGQGNLFITFGEEESLVVETDDNLQDVVETSVKHGKLLIDNSHCINHAEKLNYYVSVKSLEMVNLNGSGRIISKNKIKSNNLEILVNGSGTIKLFIQANAVSVRVNGSGNINLKGKANECSTKVSGSGNFRAFNFKVLESTVNISGSGNAYINSSDKLSVKIAGSGDVYYLGSPKIKSHISGSGSLNSSD